MRHKGGVSRIKMRTKNATSSRVTGRARREECRLQTHECYSRVVIFLDRRARKKKLLLEREGQRKENNSLVERGDSSARSLLFFVHGSTAIMSSLCAFQAVTR